MRKLLCFLIFAICLSPIYGQKKSINYSICDSWPNIEVGNISNDGKYLVYTVESSKVGSTLVIQATDSSWKKEISGGGNAVITEDCKWVIFLKTTDSLGILELGKDETKFFIGISSFKVSKRNPTLLAYQMNNSPKDLILYDFSTRASKAFHFVDEYKFSENGEVLLIRSQLNQEIKTRYLLQWLNVYTYDIDTIYSGFSAPTNMVFDSSSSQLAFIADKKNLEFTNKVIFYYKVGMDSASILLENVTLGLGDDLILGSRYDLPQFSKSGDKLFFSVKDISNIQNDSYSEGSTDVHIWNYDARLLPEKMKELERQSNRGFTAVINLKRKTIVRLEEKNESIIGKLSEIDNYLLVTKKWNNNYEWNWKVSARPAVYLVSTKDGSRKLIKKEIQDWVLYYKIAPNEKYIVFYDAKGKAYYSYDIENDITRKISGEIPYPVYNERYDMPGPAFRIGIASWLESGNELLIYDNYDIWLVNLRMESTPVNITNRYGRLNGIYLRLINPQHKDEIPILKANEQLILAGFNFQNKNNGFLKAELSSKADPIELTMGPYLYYIPPLLPSSSFLNVLTPLPLKAKNVNVHIMRRCSATDAPNVYSTQDFKRFIKLSNYQPQKEYNWMTAELIRWKMLDGKIGEGILYKPENFNPLTKYPVIFHFYERGADGLNNFLYPELSNGSLNIPYFVSQGYLVFVPNIYYKIGYPGQSVVNSVLSAAKYLQKKSWVDPKKMGLQGISFGGFEVNYLITHSNMFAAAAESAGPSDFISGYNSINGDGASAQFNYELAQARIGATLWENLGLYIENSPIFRADRVTTPLLIMHNKLDGQVTWQQGIEWFTALRRLEKKVWMLEYDNEAHGISQEKNRLDYSQRLEQFFDHYLKDKPAPKWMFPCTNPKKK